MTFSKRYAKSNTKTPPRAEPKLSHEDSRQRIASRFSQQASRLTVNNTKPPKVSFPWRFYLWLLILVALMVGGTLTWIHRNQWIFPIKHIELQGRFERVQPMAIKAVLGRYAQGSLVFFNEKALMTQLQTLPWIDQVKVKRLWPNTLLISLNEKIPVARFTDTQLLDTHGMVFTPPDMKDTDKLPYIAGPVNRAAQLWQAYNVLNNILKPTGLSIIRLEVTPRLAYTLTMNNGIVLYLGSDSVVERLNIFVKVYLKTLASRASLVQYADMRYDSGMAVGWKTQPVSTPKKVMH